MFARVTIAQIPPDRVEEGIRVARDQLVPQVQRQPGFKRMYVLMDRQSGKGMSVSLWESEEAMRQSEPAAQLAREQSAQQMGGTPTVERYEVGFSEGALSGRFARVTTTQGITAADLAGLEGAPPYVRERVLPTMRALPGYAGMLYLLDREGGTVHGVMFWDSEEALRGSADTARELREAADRAGVAGTRRFSEEYEVVLRV